MNKKEVIYRLREHLKGLRYKINEPVVYIPKYHVNWCIAYIMDFLLVPKEQAKKIMCKEVLAGTKLLDKPIPKKTSCDIGPADLSARTGISVNTIMSAIYKGRIIAFKDNGRWVIPENEAEKYKANYKGKRGKKKDENNNK